MIIKRLCSRKSYT